MIHRFLNGLLVLIFITLIALFAYKTFVTPEIVKADSKSSVSEKDNIKKEIPEDIDNIIRNYIINHPEDIIQSLEGLQQKKIEESNKKAENYLKDNKLQIENDGAPPTIGAEKGEVTIVMFYDYNCSFCKKGNEYLEQMLQEDKGVKLVLRPIPILGGTSMYAAKIAIVLHKISAEKFVTIHKEMMQMGQPLTEDGVKELIIKNGIDYAIVENEINSYSTRELINKNLEMAQNIGIKGAPSYVIEGQFIPGLLDLDKLKNIVTEIRQAK